MKKTRKNRSNPLQDMPFDKAVVNILKAKPSKKKDKKGKQEKKKEKSSK